MLLPQSWRSRLSSIVVAGFAVGLAFVGYGITVVQSAPVTVGARILLLPGATILWPHGALPLAQVAQSAMKRAAPLRPSRALAGAGACWSGWA